MKFRFNVYIIYQQEHVTVRLPFELISLTLDSLILFYMFASFLQSVFAYGVLIGETF